MMDRIVMFLCRPREGLGIVESLVLAALMGAWQTVFGYLVCSSPILGAVTGFVIGFGGTFSGLLFFLSIQDRLAPPPPPTVPPRPPRSEP